jgi:hypothetical protein
MADLYLVAEMNETSLLLIGFRIDADTETTEPLTFGSDQVSVVIRL